MKQPKDILKKYWGYDSFRPLQEEIINSVLDDIDTLALMPTGGGKSICFQVPALCKEGVCIVISPLIALMKDQVFQLKKRNISAAAIYSGMRYKDIDRLFDNAVYGGLKLLYLSPERLVTDLAIERIKKMNVNLIAVDEAHCISQWGYDFRPPYLQIAEIRELIPNAPILAVTATATKEVVEDIQQKLEFRSGKVFQKSFERKNLAYVVLEEENKEKKLLSILQNVKGSAVVYVRNRRGTKDVANLLRSKGINANFYHAGLSSKARSAKQEAWIEGKLRVMVSTNAFGMGIDKADVRSVVHMSLPDSLEAYFQEAGRAGRDGKKSYAVLLYNESDKSKLLWSYKNSFPEISEIKRVYNALGSYLQLAIGSGFGKSFDFDITAFTKNFKLDLLRTFSCLKILEQAGWIVLSDAVFIPSSIKIIVNKEQLYEYQIKNRSLDLIIRTILRTCHGVLTHFVGIDESIMSRFLKIPREQLTKAFQKMQADNILKYNQQKDKPQIIYLQARVDTSNLLIDQKLYAFRKKRYLERINKAIAYAEDDKCRNQSLLNYFGERNVIPCGICDVCLGRTKTELPADEFERYKEKIKKMLQKEKLSLEELVDSFSSNRHPIVLKTLEFLLDENIIAKEGLTLVWVEK